MWFNAFHIFQKYEHTWTLFSRGHAVHAWQWRARWQLVDKRVLSSFQTCVVSSAEVFPRKNANSIWNEFKSRYWKLSGPSESCIPPVPAWKRAVRVLWRPEDSFLVHARLINWTRNSEHLPERFQSSKTSIGRIPRNGEKLNQPGLAKCARKKARETGNQMRFRTGYAVRANHEQLVVGRILGGRRQTSKLAAKRSTKQKRDWYELAALWRTSQCRLLSKRWWAVNAERNLWTLVL